MPATKKKAATKKKVASKKVEIHQAPVIPPERIQEIWNKAVGMAVELLQFRGQQAKEDKDTDGNALFSVDCPTTLASWAYTDAIIAMRDGGEITHEEAKACLWVASIGFANMETDRMQRAIQRAMNQVDPEEVVKAFKKEHKVH